jgi:hypothetical protein
LIRAKPRATKLTPPSRRRCTDARLLADGLAKLGWPRASVERQIEEASPATFPVGRTT